MLWIPQQGIIRVEHNLGTVGSLTAGTSVTTGASATTKGTPAQIFAATAFDTYWMWIGAYEYSAVTTASQGAMDILVGAATEDILIPNLLFGYATAGGGPSGSNKQWVFPLYIPAGTRISVQAAGARTSTAFRVCIALYGGSGIPPWRVGTRVITYGMGTIPNGTTIVPGASAAEGSWTQIVAATTQDHFALFPSFQLTADTSVTTSNIAVDVGVGAATEEEIMQSLQYGITANETMSGPVPCFPCFDDIPSGTRLVMRASNSGVNDGGYNGVIHCVS